MGVVSMTRGEPPRLVETDDRAGRLLQDADEAFFAGLSPDRAWRRFQSQREKRTLVRFALVAAALGACVSFARHHWLSRTVDSATLVAERVAPRPAPISSASDPLTPERRISP